MSEVIERARTDAETDAFGLVKAWVGRPGSLGALVDGVGGVDQVGVDGTRGRAEEALDQARVEGLGARAGDPR